jgi:hypothetical protein
MPKKQTGKKPVVPVAQQINQWDTDTVKNTLKTDETQILVGDPDAPANDAQPAGDHPSFAEQAEDNLKDPDEWGVAGGNGSANLMYSELVISQHSGMFDREHTKILIYGETGTQKTRLASTFPNVIFADVDHGMSSVTEQVDTVWVPDDETGLAVMKKLYDYLRAGDHEYETVVLDTLNEMQRIIMRFTIEEFTHVRRSYGNLPGMSDYGYMLNQFMELTRSFISLPMRVVLLAQVNSQQFETDILMPQLIGKNTARELLRKIDVVGYIYKAVGPDGAPVPEVSFDSAQYVTKDRSHRLPVALTNPSFERLASHWD